MLNSHLEHMKDSIVIEALLYDEQIIKNASGLSSVADYIKNYVKSQYDPARPVASVLNILGPSILSAFGFKWLGFLLGLSKMVFGVNFTGIFQSIINKLKSTLESGKKISPSETKSIVDSAVHSGFQTGVENTSNLSKLQSGASVDTDLKNSIFIKKLSIDLSNKFNNDPNLIIKEAFIGKLLGGSVKSKTAGIFSKLIGWLVRVVLYTAGFLGAGALVSGISGKNSNPKQKGILPTKEEENEVNSTTSLPPIKSHSLKLDSSHSNLMQEHKNDQYNIWIEKNKAGSIKEQLAQWAIDLYPDLKAHKDLIFQSANFNSIFTLFTSKNKDNASLIVVPDEFSSVKEIADRFVGDIAEKIK